MPDTLTLPQVAIEEIEVFAGDLAADRAAAIYREHGCLVARGLHRQYVETIHRDLEAVAQESIALLPRKERIVEGWRTPNGTLFIPAPPGYDREQQIMVLGVNYSRSAAFLRSALDERTLDIAEAILGPNIELFGNGQSLYKEPVGGHPKHLHQDASYFEHRYEGPVATLTYVVDTDLVNGALHVVPGSQRLRTLPHIDTFSHLGLDPDEWPWERALPVIGAAGDVIFFHVHCIHGSQENHSDQARPVYINRYRRPDDYVIISATTAAKRAAGEQQAAQAKRDSRGGIMARGFRAFDPDA